MKRFVKGVAVASALSLSACSSATHAERQAETMEASMELNEERKELAEEWLEAGVSVAEKAQNQRALELMEYAVDNHDVGFPGTKGVATMTELDGNDIVVLPLFETDAELNPYLSGIWSEPAHAVVLEDINSLVLKNKVEMNETGKGILMIHEADHAKRFKENINSPTEEAEVYEFQFEVMEDLAGEKYLELVKEVHEVVEPTFHITDDGTFGISLFRPSAEEIEEVFGDLKSDYDERWLGGSVWLHAVRDVIKNRFNEGDYLQAFQFFLDGVEQGQHGNH